MDKQAGLVDFLALVVCPALFERLDQAFPEFGWTRTGRGWKATSREYTKSAFGVRPDRVVCNRAFGFVVYGQGTTNWISYVNNGTSPTGRDFAESARKLADLAGVDTSVPDWPWAAQQAIEAPPPGVHAAPEDVDIHLRSEPCNPSAEPVRDVVDEVEDHTKHLDRYTGREFIGLPQRTLETLDEATLGLRGLVFLVAPANADRAALAIQLGTDVVVHNEDTCFLLVSPEMSRWDILTRIKSRLAGMDWEKLVLGSGKGPDQPAFTMDELGDIQEAEQVMAEIGRRVRILDERNCPQPTVETVLDHLAQLKANSGASRAFVLVNHLQKWPVPDHQQQELRCDADRDKWRLEAMCRLRDAAEADALVVVTEARPPAGRSGDVKGEGQNPNIVLLFRPFDEHELSEAYAKHHGNVKGENGHGQNSAVRQWKDSLQRRDGITLNKLAITDGPDEVQKTAMDLTFHFRRSEFEEGLPKWDCWT